MNRLLPYMLRLLSRARRRRATVQFTSPAQMPPEEMLRAFGAITEKHPLWRAFHQLLDDSQAAKITDALDPESHGEENAYRRGEANALAEFKARLLETHAAATRMKVPD